MGHLHSLRGLADAAWRRELRVGLIALKQRTRPRLARVAASAPGRCIDRRQRPGEGRAQTLRNPTSIESAPMRRSPGIVHLTHQAAHAIEFDGASTQATDVAQHAHATRQHGSGVRSEHEYFGAVCDLLEEFPRVIVAGGHTSLADFRHYVDKHRSSTAGRITAYEVVDHPTDHQRGARARARFDAFDRLA